MGGVYNPSNVVCCLAVNFSSWITIGALAYSDRLNSMNANDRIGTLIILSGIFLISFTVILGECSYKPTFCAGSLFAAGGLGASTTMAYLIVTPSDLDGFYTTFWAMTASLAACWLELNAGLIKAFERRLASY